MKPIVFLFLVFEFLLPTASSRTFVHPGAIDSRAELDFVKARIQAGDQPWKGEFEQIKNSGEASREPHGIGTIDANNYRADVSQADASAAYTQALLWYYTGDEIYARRAIAILNSWANLQAITANADSEQDRLKAGWLGAVFAPAAEIMRLYPQWSIDEIQKLQAMFKRAFYPKLNKASFWNGNVDLTQIDAMMAIAVFNEDEAEFNEALARLKIRTPAYFYLTSDGPTPSRIAGDGDDLKKFWFHPGAWVDGLTQETCRDNGHHAQFGLGSALHAAELAWHQGVDVYTENTKRYTAALELMASHFLADSMQGLSPDDRPTSHRFDLFEIGYNHYHVRAGMDLPNTRRLILEQIRPKAVRASCNINYETLTHANLPGALAQRGETIP